MKQEQCKICKQRIAKAYKDTKPVCKDCFFYLKEKNERREENETQ